MLPRHAGSAATDTMHHWMSVLLRVWRTSPRICRRFADAKPPKEHEIILIPSFDVSCQGRNGTAQFALIGLDGIPCALFRRGVR